MKHTPPATISLITTWSLIFLCLCSLFFSGKWLAAEYYADKVLEQRDLWDSYGDIYFLEEWENALGNINTAIALHNNKAEFFRLRGLIYEWRRLAPYPEDQDLNPMQELRRNNQIQIQARENALQSYRQSASLRPIWPVTWYKVAHLKGIMDEFDNEFAEAVEKSFEYGKNLEFMQNNLTDLTLRFFAEIQSVESIQDLQHAHLGKLLGSGNPRPTLNLIRRFRLLEEVCRQVKENEYVLNNISSQACDQATE